MNAERDGRPDPQRTVPLGHPRPLAPTKSQRLQPSSTGFATALALSPLGVALSILVLLLNQFPLTWISIATVAAFAMVTSLWIAHHDRLILRQRGYKTSPSPLLVLLTPAGYLLVRGHRAFNQDMDSLRPLWLHVLICGFLLASLLIVQLFGGAAISLWQMRN